MGCAVYPEVVRALDFKLITIDCTAIAADSPTDPITTLPFQDEAVTRVAEVEKMDVVTVEYAVYPEIVHALDFKLIEIDATAASADVPSEPIIALPSQDAIEIRVTEEENTDVVTKESAVYPEIIHALDFKLIESDAVTELVRSNSQELDGIVYFDCLDSIKVV